MTTKTDVLIIGGGSIGLHAAYYLLRSGRTVTLIDQATIGKGSSSGNAGHIATSHIIPLAAPGSHPSSAEVDARSAEQPFWHEAQPEPALHFVVITVCTIMQYEQCEPRHSATQGFGIAKRPKFFRHYFTGKI